jgi:DNA (cytosine-5)-methyltransferase 1
MAVYYNEIDLYCCQWLAELARAGLIPVGDIDSRSIREVTAGDLKGYAQHHFFAGLGGWCRALRLAGWPDDQPVWTGSCPCQPFSLAGKRKGFNDERDLWPVWANLIRKCCPPVVFGEQVAAATQWLSRVRSDMEAMGYALGAMPIQAAGAGACQYRDRFWFVASVLRPRLEGRESLPANTGAQLPAVQRGGIFAVVRPPLDGWGQGWTESEFRSRGFTAAVASSQDGSIQFIECPDGKWRRLPPPRVRWLGNGIPARVAKLRALGNAIYPPVAAAWVRAYMDYVGVGV